MRRIVLIVLAAILLFSEALAQSAPLAADDAFRMSASRAPEGMIELTWKIAPGYYLYRDHIDVLDSASGATIGLDLPSGTVKLIGGRESTVVYYDQVSVLAAATDGKIKATYQGCRENSICYPPATKIVDVRSLGISEAEGEHAKANPTGANNRMRAGREAEDRKEYPIASLWSAACEGYVGCVRPERSATTARELEH